MSNKFSYPAFIHNQKLKFDPVYRVVHGALKSAIHDHGPITTEAPGHLLAAATKRVTSQLRSADLIDKEKENVRKRNGKKKLNTRGSSWFASLRNQYDRIRYGQNGDLHTR